MRSYFFGGDTSLSCSRKRNYNWCRQTFAGLHRFALHSSAASQPYNCYVDGVVNYAGMYISNHKMSIRVFRRRPIYSIQWIEIRLAPNTGTFCGVPTHRGIHIHLRTHCNEWLWMIDSKEVCADANIADSKTLRHIPNMKCYHRFHLRV